MRVLCNRRLLFTMAVILTVYTLSASAVPAKDHKKKLLEKLRNSLNSTEVEEAAAAAAATGGADAGTLEVGLESAENVTAPGGAEPNPEAKTVDEDHEHEHQLDREEKEEDHEEEEAHEEKEEKHDTKKKVDNKEKSENNSTEVATKQDGNSSYLLKMRSMLKRIFDMFGFRQNKKKDGRQNRMLHNDDSFASNGIEYEYFREDIRTTVGAVLGEKECIKKIVCGAGSYLRDVNGKHVILTILENVTPSAWLDTMNLLKKSAVTDGECSYKCLESEEGEH